MDLGNIFPIKDKSFGVRLKSLIDYNNLDVSSLATRICGFDCKPSIGDKSYSTFASARRIINKHLSIKGSLFDAGNNVTSQYISDYCQILGCEPDFLFGCIDFPKHEETDINKKLGLSKKAIGTLLSLNKRGILADEDFSSLDLLNFILSDRTLFCDFLDYLGLYVNNTYDTPCYLDPNKHVYIPVPDDNIRNTPFVVAKNERYIAVGKKQPEKVCGEDAYQTICLPVSLLESHALRIVQSVIDKWKNKYSKINKK